MNYNKRNTFCNNCGKLGHLFHQCKIPITSIGVISIRKNSNTSNTEVLLVCRKDTLSFVDFMRGKYNLDDKTFILNLFNKMTTRERQFILDNEFSILWNYLWGNNNVNQYKNEEKMSRIKFNELKSGYTFNNISYNMFDIINLCTEYYKEPEWGFPKGRRNYQERDLVCGLREFEEETGYDKSDITLINNILPLEEIFTGSNFKSYKHKYFLGYFNNLCEPRKEFQTFEISKILWVNLEEAHNYIRDYNIEKKNVLFDIINLLKTYKLYI